MERLILYWGGNLFGFPPQFGRLDASYGHVLTNKGEGTFTWIENKTSGLDLRGEIKDIKELNGKTGKRYLITRNDQLPVILQVKN